MQMIRRIGKAVPVASKQFPVIVKGVVVMKNVRRFSLSSMSHVTVTSCDDDLIVDDLSELDQIVGLFGAKKNSDPRPRSRRRYGIIHQLIRPTLTRFTADLRTEQF